MCQSAAFFYLKTPVIQTGSTLKATNCRNEPNYFSTDIALLQGATNGMNHLKCCRSPHLLCEGFVAQICISAHAPCCSRQAGQGRAGLLGPTSTPGQALLVLLR